ncbi:MAG TPA: YggS family pyridoxal phosphate-dependent enzyme [Bacteroidales bacterium]|jgi:hypothetical protein|nr:YggS family pyridoxal phosphate-dependent enzyme [Bacteroidales bacterium]HRS19196.1 YggS family pyridoxal phosphate-dependent enzyme [Bacteroidales bacterium]
METSIQYNIRKIKESIPNHVLLVAVSKTKPVSDIMQAYEIGIKDFGENKVQELVAKYEQLPKDIRWHFIGHLQTNKVKYIAPFVSLIHGIDSLKLLQAINKEAIKCNRIIPCLLQFHIAQEETKFGLSLQEAHEILQSHEFTTLHNIQINGVMGMASYVDDSKQIQQEFKELYLIYKELKQKYFNNSEYFCQLSMGMSQDYTIAIEQGSTIIRIGSTIFGERNLL